MPRFGGYESVQELLRTPLGSVYSARAAGESGEPALVVRTCQPSSAVAGEDGARRAVRAFVEQARVQQRAAGGSGGVGATIGTHWARIYEIGDLAAAEEGGVAGAYVVTDLAPRGSLERLVNARVRPTGRQLATVVGSIVEGLREIRGACGRGHGDLRLTNVLLLGKGDFAQSRVVLCDPAAEAGGVTHTADLRAVGEIIHALVVHQGTRGVWPIAPSGAWSSLGASGAGWRGLADELLNPDEGVERPTLEDLSERVARLRAARSRRGPALIAGAATLLTVGVGVWLLVGRGGGGKPPPPPAVILQWLNDAEAPVRWKGYCEEYRGWFATFAKRLDEPPPRALRGPSLATRREVYQKNAGLAAVLARLESAGLIRAAGSRAGDPTYADPWSLADVSSDRDLRALGEQPTMQAQYDGNVERVKAALPALTAAREALRTWAEGQRLGALGAEWTGLGWRSAGEYAAGVSKALREGPSADTAAEIDAALGALAAVERIERVQAAIGRARGVMEGAGDPVLSKFGAAVGPMAAGSGGGGAGGGEAPGPEALPALEARLKSVAELAVELEQFVKQRWGTIDAEAFQESQEYRALSAADPPTKSTYEAWLYQAPGFRALTEPDPRGEWSAAAMLGPLNAAMTRLAALGGTPPEGSAEALTALGARIEALAPTGVKWNRNNRERIEREAPAVRGELAALRRRLEDLVGELTASAQEARERIRTRVESGAGAPAAEAVWRAERDRLLAAYPTDEQTPQLVREERAARETLRALVEQVRGAGDRAGLSGSLAAAADEHAAGLIEALLAAAPGSAAPTLEAVRTEEMSARVASASERQAAFVSAMGGLSRSLAAAVGALSQGYGVDEPWGGELTADAGGNGSGGSGGGDVTVGGLIDRLAASEEASRFAGVRESIAPLKERVADARRLARETDAGVLTGEVAGAGRDRPERALAAWRRLGEAEVGWPADASQLAGAERLRSSLEQVSAAIADGVRSERVRERTRGEFRERYLAYLGRCGSAACVEAGLAPEVMQGFGVEVGMLPAAARYNMLLREARAAVRAREGIDDPEAARMIGAFVEAARGVDAGVAARPTVRGLLDELTGLIGPEPPKPKIDPVTLGPGSAGWTGVMNAATGGLTFTRGGVSLEFLRFEGDEGRGVAPFYLATTEVSLALFRGLVGEGWDELATVLTPPETDDEDAWQGPRVWKHDAQARFVRNAAWVQRDPLMTRQLPAFAASLVDKDSPVKLAPAAGGNPQDDHPVQRLPPAVMAWAAKRAGCRVPSGAEWQLAYQSIKAPGPSAQVNLRDAAFAAQRDHTREARTKAGARMDVFKYPDTAIAGGQQGGAPAEQSAAVHGDWNDGHLFFAPVTGGPLPLRHLIGNVGELVFEKPELLDALPAAVSIDQAASVLSREEGAIRVIGGSALSPPSIPLDQATPIGMSEEGYADLGFRLCFSAAGTAPAREPLVSKFARLLTDDRYLLAGR